MNNRTDHHIRTKKAVNPLGKTRYLSVLMMISLSHNPQNRRMQPQTTTASHMMAIHAQEITLPDQKFSEYATKAKWTI